MSDLLASGDHMDVGLSARVRSPCEGPVSEGDLQRTAVEKDRPWLAPLAPLSGPRSAISQHAGEIYAVDHWLYFRRRADRPKRQ